MATARGEDIAQAAENRLRAAVAEIDAAPPLLKAATDAEATAWAAVSLPYQTSAPPA